MQNAIVLGKSIGRKMHLMNLNVKTYFYNVNFVLIEECHLKSRIVIVLLNSKWARRELRNLYLL